MRPWEADTGDDYPLSGQSAPAVAAWMLCLAEATSAVVDDTRADDSKYGDRRVGPGYSYSSSDSSQYSYRGVGSSTRMVYQEVDLPQDSRQALEALSLLSRKWHPVVIAVLDDCERAGFNDLLDSIPDISGKVLSDTLDALQEAGLVDRTVVSESPLRVEYALTGAGRDLDGVFAELAAWGEDHLDSVTPTILVVESDRRITEMYGGWLGDRYSVRRAHDSEQVDDHLDDDVDVVLFARAVPGVDPSRVPEVAPPRCRTVLLVDEKPDLSLLELDCDDVLFKPLVRETALDAVETHLSRQGEPDTRREREALDAKRVALEQAYGSDTLDGHETYARLCARIDELDAELDDG